MSAIKEPSRIEEAKRKNKESAWLKYRELNNLLKWKCNEARELSENNLTPELSEDNNPKRFWNFVKSLQKGTTNLISLKVGNLTISDNLSIHLPAV